MKNFMAKLFVKDYDKPNLPEVRFRYGIVAGIFGIISNIILFAAKIVAGIVSGSLTIIADAINNLSDAGTSSVTVVGFKISSRPADKEHPYGHARFEYIAAFMVAMLVMVIGVLLAKESVTKIIDVIKHSANVDTTASEYLLSYIVLGSAIIMKLLQMLLYRSFGKIIDSDALRASAADSRNDVISTAVALLAQIIMQTTKVDLDGYFGAAVSIFITVSSIMLIKETIDPLLGGKPDEELSAQIKQKILSYDGILGVHDLMVHSYGVSQVFAVAHAEVSALADIMDSHDIIDNIEKDVRESMGVHLTLHLDPVEVNNPEVNEWRARVAEVIAGLGSDFSFHDFRMVPGETHTNVLFDVVIPWDSKLTKDDMVNILEEKFKDEDKKYYFVIEVDRICD